MTDADAAGPTPQPPGEYRFEPGDVFHGMGGDYWIVTARLWNYDAEETARHGHYGETYDVTRDYHRREYELSSLDPLTMGGETQRLHEADLDSHFESATAEAAREHYRSDAPDGHDIVTDGGQPAAPPKAVGLWYAVGFLVFWAIVALTLAFSLGVAA